MTVSLVVACIWAVAATIIAVMPARLHWRAAYGLIAAGIPLLGWVTLQNGPVWGLVCLAAGASLLRWPAIRLWRRLWPQDGGSGEPAE